MNRYPFCATPSRPFLPAMRLSCCVGASALLGACASPPPLPLASTHLQSPPLVAGTPPDFVLAPPLPKPPRPLPKQELYSVVMKNVSVQDLLFALARDAKLNVDIHPAISGTVTMNVHDQTLTEILDRVAHQVDLRYEMQGRNLSIQPDVPYLRSYRVDYPNIQRSAVLSISTSTNVASTGSALGGSDGGTGSNASTSEIGSKTSNQFWDTLVGNVRDMLRETDKLIPSTEPGAAPPAPGLVANLASAPTTTAPTTTASTHSSTASGGGSSANGITSAGQGRTLFREAASVMANPETGYISVRATQAQHKRVREFLDRVMQSARRQVLIEATIVEVDLSSRYQQGIDWSLMRPGGSVFDSSVSLSPNGARTGFQTGGAVSSLANLTLTGASFIKGYDLTAMLRMLESFGTLRVLSSPKISVLNNQSSVLKVVDNKVFFTLSVTPGTPASLGVAATPATYTTTINTVPIGLLMTVTPQISASGEVILNTRPTISRITGYAVDPNPVLAENGTINRIPEVQTREMESVLRVQSGGIAILGGLMQDARDNRSDEVPGLNRVPLFGNLFKYRDESSKKTELVIFLRPTVVQNPSLEGDFNGFQTALQSARDAMDTPAAPARPEFEFQQNKP